MYEGEEASCVVNVLAGRGLHTACVRAIAKCEVNGSVEKLWGPASSEAQWECVLEDDVGEVKDVSKQNTKEHGVTLDLSPLQSVMALLKKEKCLAIAFLIGLFTLVVSMIIASRF